MSEKEVFEFKICCNSCGATITTRSDDGQSASRCPNKGCSGKMICVKMRELSPEEISGKVTVSTSSAKSGRVIGL